MNRVYLDNAATTPLSREFITDSRFILERFGNPSTGYTEGREAKEMIEEVRNFFAGEFKCSPNQLFFTSGSTEGINWTMETFYPTILLTDETEHEAVLESTIHSDYTRFIPIDSNGIVDVDYLYDFLQSASKDARESILVSIMAVNNETGVIQPIKEISDICNQFGCYFHIDATQAIGHIPFDVETYPCDAFTCSAHKFYGMKSVGIQYFKDPDIITPMVLGGGQEKGFRSGTENTIGIISAKYGYEFAMSNREKLEDVSDYLYGILTDMLVDNIHFSVDRNCTIPSTISFRLDGISNTVLQTELDVAGFSVGTGSACSGNGANKISHVLRTIGLTDEEASGTIRVSLGCFNTIAEVTDFAYTLKKICRNFGGKNNGK